MIRLQSGNLPTPKLAFIDSLRGFAALYVLLFHLGPVPRPMVAAPQWLAPFVGLGGSGVALFFVVSAFTLSLSMDARRGDEATPLAHYFLRRFFRIAPLFYLWIVLYLVRDRLVFHTGHSFGDILRSVLFVLNLSPGHETGFVWASWTIGVEMLFYVFFPAIFAWTDSIAKAAGLFLFSLLLRAPWHAAVFWMVKDAARAQSYYTFSLPRHLPTFLLGIFLYRVYARLDREAARRLGLGTLLIAAAIATLLTAAYGLVDFSAVDSLTLQALICGALLLGLAIHAPRVLVNPVTCFYGRISYSVYLGHPSTLYFLAPAFAWFFARIANPTLAYGACVALALGAVTALACVTYRYVETPGNAAGRRLIRARQERRGLSAA